MKAELFIVKEILGTNKIQRVLDVGVGKGYASLLCASYGARVDAVDNGMQENSAFPVVLEDHPSISFYRMNIEDFTFPHTYDLILMTNIVMFLEKENFFETLFPKIVSSLSKDGRIVLSFFLSDDQSLKEWMHAYALKDFTISGVHVEKSFDKIFQEDHFPNGLHVHHIQYVVLKKV